MTKSAIFSLYVLSNAAQFGAVGPNLRHPRQADLDTAAALFIMITSLITTVVSKIGRAPQGNRQGNIIALWSPN